MTNKEPNSPSENPPSKKNFPENPSAENPRGAIPPSADGKREKREVGSEAPAVKPAEQTDTSKVLETADRIAREILENPEKRGEYEKKVIEALQRFGEKITECNQRASATHEDILKGCTEATGEQFEGNNAKIRIGEKIGKIVEGLNAGTLSVHDVATILAFQATEDGSNRAFVEFQNATKQSAQGISREMPKGE